MRAMQFHQPDEPLRLVEVPRPTPSPGQVLIQVEACGLCRTDLHIQDGDIDGCRYPVIPGHQIVGRVVAGNPQLAAGTRVGVPWLGSTCGACFYCRHDQENLCDRAQFTGCHIDGGFAELAVADVRYCLPLDDRLDPLHAAPLLCAGLIGYRALRLSGTPRRLGIYGFGAAGHLLVPVARHLGAEVHAFTRPGDATGQQFARELGCVWAGDSDQSPDQPLDAAIIFAPVGSLVPAALKAVRKGGRVVCGGIHMSDIPSFPYADLWGERSICSVANLTRRDGTEFLAIAAAIDLEPTVTAYDLEQANQALDDLREGRINGAAVIIP